MVTEEQVWQALQEVTDPEYPLSIVDLGMIYDVDVQAEQVNITMTFTAIGCPAIEMIISDMKEAVLKLPDVKKVDVEIVWSPPWTKDKITSKGREILQYYGVGV
ncbi:metal-sulfur cluster assembly factor [candidate division KSB1 bacterium]|nr:metal-sulfur cluster assembly factor [candidate division KSB1 bacterium]NIR70695.1 metal-sulfur cluster assembly factor [candidate division KSB1 bacterium]NIS27759.1 metal-sulfur cluster assembly factor [candidate division KSB1 bacterium]NIT74606.1 metal-sulfur cluster assembly factor [candidate division KSB1 bacterium]NIU28426.1 metal-sulfur cluster assembly factor [candidate division KSB1 bacterium]